MRAWVFVALVLGSPSRASSEAVKLVPQVSRVGGFAMVASDGRYAIRSQDMQTYGLWDHQSGIYLGDRAYPVGTRRDISISPDGRYIAYDAVKEIIIEDLDTGKLRRIGPMANEVTALWFSRDGSRVFTTHGKVRVITMNSSDAEAYGNARGPDHAVSAWDFATGKRVSELAYNPADFTSSRPFVNGASPDELYTSTRLEIRRHDTTNAKRVERIVIPKELHGGPNTQTDLVVSADGKRAVTRHVKSLEAKIEIVMAYWDWTQRKVTSTVQVLAPTNYQMPEQFGDDLAISPDGSHVIIRGRRTNIRLYRFGESTPVKELPNHHDVLAFTKDGKHVVVGTSLRSASTGELVIPELQGTPITSSRVAMHGSMVFVARDKSLSAWDLQTLERRWTRTEGVSDGVPMSLTVSPDGAKLTALALKTRRVHIYDAVTGAVISDQPPIERPYWSGVDEESRDRKWAVRIASGAQLAELRALDTGAVVRTVKLAGPEWLGKTLLWTAHGFISVTNGTLQFWNVSSDKPIATHVVDKPPRHAEHFGTQMAVSQDGNTVAISTGDVRAGRGDIILMLFDARTGAQLRSSTLPALGWVSDLVVADDRKWALVDVAGTPVAINLERAASVRLIEDRDQWVIADAGGIFTASAGGGRLLAAVRGRTGFLIEQLALRNNDPGKLMRALGTGSEEQRKYYDHAYKERLRRAGIAAAAVGDMFESIPEVQFAGVKQEGDHADIQLQLDAPRGLSRYHIDVNGVPVFGSGGKPATGKSQRITERIQLGRGTNRVELRVVDAAGIEGLRPVRLLDTERAGTSDLYFLGFGISDYANPAFKLEYARKDVLDIAAALQHASPEFARVHTRVYVDAAVTPLQIRAAKEFVAAAGVDDLVVVMIAGHGVHANDSAARYYFVTHATDVGRLAETAAPFEDIESLLDGITSRRKLFLMDTCESGERDPGEEAAAVSRAGSRGLKARTTRGLKVVGEAKPASRRFVLERDNFLFNGILRRSGAVVFSSSRGSELSYEAQELGNGVFTQAVLETLIDKTSDLDGNGITIAELRTRVAKRVAEYTNGAQNPTIERDNLGAVIAFPVLTDAQAITDRATAPLADYAIATGTGTATSTAISAPVATRTVRSQRGCGCHTGSSTSSVALAAFVAAWLLKRRRGRSLPREHDRPASLG